MESKVNYTLVGFFVVILSIAGIVFFFWLFGFRSEKSYHIYLVYVQEDVTGLTVQSPVRFNGVTVGFVDAIDLDAHNQQLVRLQLKIEDGTRITTQTVASLYFQGITGVLYVGLKSQRSNAPLLRPLPGEQYPVIPWQPSLLVQFSQVLPEITKNMQSIGDKIEALFSRQNQKNITASLSNLAQFTQVLAGRSQELNSTIESLQHVMKNTATASDQFPQLLNQINHTLSELQNTSLHINQATQSMQGLANKGDVAIENISTQLLPSTDQTIMNLNEMIMNLKTFTDELQRNPSLLIRGKTPAQPGPGEVSQ